MLNVAINKKDGNMALTWNRGSKKCQRGRMQHAIYIYRNQWNLGQICYIF